MLAELGVLSLSKSRFEESRSTEGRMKILRTFQLFHRPKRDFRNETPVRDCRYARAVRMCGARRRVSQRFSSAQRDRSKQALRSIPRCARIHARGSSRSVAGVGRLARQHRSARHGSFHARRVVPKLRGTHSDWTETISTCRNCLSRSRSALAGVGCASVHRTRLGVCRYASPVERGRC